MDPELAQLIQSLTPEQRQRLSDNAAQKVQQQQLAEQMAMAQHMAMAGNPNKAQGQAAIFGVLGDLLTKGAGMYKAHQIAPQQQALSRKNFEDQLMMAELLKQPTAEPSQDGQGMTSPQMVGDEPMVGSGVLAPPSGQQPQPGPQDPGPQGPPQGATPTMPGGQPSPEMDQLQALIAALQQPRSLGRAYGEPDDDDMLPPPPKRRM